MKYMMLVKVNRSSEDGQRYEQGLPPDAKLQAAVGQHAQELVKAGILVDTGGLLPIPKGAQIRAKNGKLTITDGPFIESKEVIGGYAVLKAKSKEEAIELGKAFMKIHVDVLGHSYEGELEVRQMFDPVDCAPEAHR